VKQFVDVERAMLALLDREFAAAGLGDLVGKSDTSWPDPVEVPFVRVERLGGRRTRLMDFPWVDVEVLHHGGEGKLLIEAIDTILSSYPRGVEVAQDTGDPVFVKLELVSTPRPIHRLPWDSDDVRRYAATYQLRASRP
jgi:hypothetical protein